MLHVYCIAMFGEAINFNIQLLAEFPNILSVIFSAYTIRNEDNISEQIVSYLEQLFGH